MERLAPSAARVALPVSSLSLPTINAIGVCASSMYIPLPLDNRELPVLIKRLIEVESRRIPDLAGYSSYIRSSTVRIARGYVRHFLFVLDDISSEPLIIGLALAALDSGCFCVVVSPTCPYFSDSNSMDFNACGRRECACLVRRNVLSEQTHLDGEQYVFSSLCFNLCIEFTNAAPRPYDGFLKSLVSAYFKEAIDQNLLPIRSFQKQTRRY